jgi:hypothetical protein
VSEGVRDSFWLPGSVASFKGTFDCVKAFSETDFTEDLKKIDVPALVLHGDDDQIVPIAPSAMISSKLLKNATLKVYRGAARHVHDPQGPGERGPPRFHRYSRCGGRRASCAGFLRRYVVLVSGCQRLPPIFFEVSAELGRHN